MSKISFTLFLLSAIFVSTNVVADQSCLLETNATYMGMKLDIKDCIQNAGMKSNIFKSQCEGMSEAAVSMDAPPPKITYLPSCPEPFQAKCDNTKTAKTIFFYYKRESDEFSGLKSGCELMKGKYTRGTLK